MKRRKSKSDDLARRFRRMKRRKSKSDDLTHRFHTTCGWCGRKIPPDVPVFGGTGKSRPDVDLTAQAGSVLPLHLVSADKTVLIAVAGLDSEARREGADLVYMTCSEDCARNLNAAFARDIEMAKQSGLK
jgi:hypothetical protein